jgi:hypothetical protein
MEEVRVNHHEEIEKPAVKFSQTDDVEDSGYIDHLPMVGSSNFTMMPNRPPQTYSSVTVKREEVGWKNMKSGLQFHSHEKNVPLNPQLSILNQHHHLGIVASFKIFMVKDRTVSKKFHLKFQGLAVYMSMCSKPMMSVLPRLFPTTASKSEHWLDPIEDEDQKWEDYTQAWMLMRFVCG